MKTDAPLERIPGVIQIDLRPVTLAAKRMRENVRRAYKSPAFRRAIRALAAEQRRRDDSLFIRDVAARELATATEILDRRMDDLYARYGLTREAQ